MSALMRAPRELFTGEAVIPSWLWSIPPSGKCMPEGTL